MPRIKAMNEKDLALVCQRAIEASTWFDSTEIASAQGKALDSYYGRDNGDDEIPEGRSDARSQDVADMVEAVVSQMMPAFDFETIAEFDPQGAGDFDQARLESVVCNSHLRNKNKGYIIIQEAVRNALLLRNGILKVAAESRQDVQRQRYKGLTALELDNALTPTAPQQEVEITSSEVHDDDTADMSVKRTTMFRRLVIESTDPTQFLVTKNWWKTDFDGVPMVGERYFLASSDLREMGVSQARINKLGRTDTDTNAGTAARNRDETTSFFAETPDPSRTMVECFELYLLVDYDGDGISERRKVLYAGGTSGGEVVKNQIGFIPYGSGTPFLQAQRWLGMSLWDKLREIEKQKTEGLRQWLDNLAYGNNNELIVDDGVVNVEDLKARRPGGINRAENPEKVVPLPVQDLSGASRSFLDYADKVRSERGGASLDLQSAELQLAGETAHGIDRQYDSKEQLAQLMTRTIAESLIRQTFELIHETLRREFPQQQTVRLGSQFVAFEPGQWHYRDELTIVAGMTASERAQMQSALQMIVAAQQKTFEDGLGSGILTNLQTYQAALVDWSTAGGLRTASRYWLDPRSPESVEAQQAAAKARQEAAAKSEAQQREIIGAQMQIENDKNRVELAKTTGNLKFKYWEAEVQSELDQLQIENGGGEADQVDALQAEAP